MVDVETQTYIKCSRDKVAEYVADPNNAPQWYVNIKSVEWKTLRPLSVGSQILFKAQFLGRQLSYTYEVVEYIPHQKLVMQTAEGPFPMETIYTWESIDDNTTRMTLRNKGNPSGFSKLFSPFMATAMRKANKKDLERLKQILENKFGK
jgi:uncharacterized membrane protein